MLPGRGLSRPGQEPCCQQAEDEPADVGEERHTAPDAEIALSAAAGGMLGLLRMCQRRPERVTEATVDQLAEAVLRLLGVPADEAGRLAALPLPPIEAW